MWVMAVGDAILSQLPLHEDDHSARAVAFRLIGTILQMVGLRLSASQSFPRLTFSDLLGEP